MKQIIQTEAAPAAIGPYSQAVRHNGFLFISGQLGLSPENGTLAAGIEAQTTQCMNNLAAILRAAGLQTSHLLKVSIFLTDLAHFETVNHIYASILTEPYPAREVIQVAALPKGAEVEISAIAAAPSS